MVQILLRTGEIKRKAISREEVKVNMPPTRAGHLVPEFQSFTTDTFKQKAMKKSRSSRPKYVLAASDTDTSSVDAHGNPPSSSAKNINSLIFPQSRIIGRVNVTGLECPRGFQEV